MAVEALHERAAIGMPELVRDVLGRQLKVIEEPRSAEMAQLIEVHRRTSEPAADGVPVIVLDPSRHRPTAPGMEHERVPVDWPRKLQQRILSWRRKDNHALPAVLWQIEATRLPDVLPLDEDLVLTKVEIRPAEPVQLRGTHSHKRRHEN